MVTATIGGIPVGTYGTGILTIPADITGDVTITSNTQLKLPDGVSMGKYNKDTNTPEGAGATILEAFNGYYYLTFANVNSEANGRWIIIGAHGLLLGNNVGDPKNELGSGQVLLLSEGCIRDSIFHDKTDGNTDNKWQGSDVQNACIDIYNNSGLSSYKVVTQSLTTKWYASPDCETNDNMFLLAGRGEKFNAGTYLTTNAKRDIDINKSWWLRSGDNSDDNIGYQVILDGRIVNNCDVGWIRGVRPAFVFDMRIRAILSFNCNGGILLPEPVGYQNQQGSITTDPREVIYNEPIGDLPSLVGPPSFGGGGPRPKRKFLGWTIDDIAITAETPYTWTENKTAVAQWTAT